VQHFVIASSAQPIYTRCQRNIIFISTQKKKNIITQRMSTEIVRVCTFNIRHSYLDHGTPNEWQKRRPILKQCLENMQPTIIGIQEGDPPQLKDILDDLNQ
jgi:mRNA deadenylase 3'-5' endonuclease subunit Ccr4